MYCYKFPNDYNKILDGRTFLFAGHEIGIGREKISKILRNEELCNSVVANKIVSRFKPNDKITDYFIKLNESEAREFYGKRNKRINKSRFK